MAEKNNEPVKRSRPCAGIELAVWENGGSPSSYYTVSLRKSWKDKAGEFNERKLSLSPEQLAAVAIDARRLCEWMSETPAGNEPA